MCETEILGDYLFMRFICVIEIFGEITGVNYLCDRDIWRLASVIYVAGILGDLQVLFIYVTHIFGK